ncbi:hypothetical protein NDA11_001363 [Ustilago hordei]|nr:hypothetical protein NDA10_001921 [Ustilago hordei]KAJ1586377.1 hypothetical protein NDA12_007394 [Ustilago hordei]KAJ1589274.1 hypothetical protein NDA15_004025 [Ustilago hordei]KAJ1590628.1 hypothetical protein NDA11_001363 [Ustilago hordei]KAJ1600718.1 hypothetical protein NDA14_003055 [Ustilago hordei]
MAKNGMLLLNGLPTGSQFTIDSHTEAYLTNEQFAGIKGLPAGWHCISWSIASTQSSFQAGAVGVEGSVRNVLLRWFDEGEASVRELDRAQQRLVAPDQLGSGSSIGRSKQFRTSRTFDPSSKAISTIITLEVMNSVEPRLLPYPSAARKPWQDALRHLSVDNGRVGRKVVVRVLGVDVHSGDSNTDSLATGPSRARDGLEQTSIQHTGNLGRSENGKIIWGKSRPESEREALELFGVVAADDDEEKYDFAAKEETESKKRKRSSPTSNGKTSGILDDEDSLLFTTFDLQRSWPPNSIGADITRWSEDKSWLLQDVACRSRSSISEGDCYLPVLCEFELAFVLFVSASNSYVWEQWKDLVALFCRSSTLIGASSAFQVHPSQTGSPSVVPTQIRLDSHIAFLFTLRSQLALLQPDFWSTQTSFAEERAVLKELDTFRSNLARSLSAASIQHTDPGAQLEEKREQMVTAWRTLSHLTASRFGWQLDRRLDEEAEVEDDMQAEEGEDAPIIVEI